MISARVILWGTEIGAVYQESISSVPKFSYSSGFLKSGIQIAPLTMPLSGQIYSFPSLNQDTFLGLPGPLADSLPDKYGTAVLTKYLEDQGRPADSISAVERLCYIGQRGMGALEYEPEIGIGQDDGTVDIAGLVNLASDILAQRRELHVNSMQQMITVGTSAGGARAKAIIAWNRENGDIRSGQIDAGKGYEYWIIKFDGVENNKDHDEDSDGTEYTRIEYAYHNMAKAAGVRMSECLLFEENGRHHFMTKRFDRDENGRKLHMLSLGGMAHMDYKMPGAHSYEEVSNIIYQLGLPASDAEQLFCRMAFNDLARNYDDHVKNTAFLMNRQGIWSLAPAYDITYEYDKSSMWVARHQMSINGKLEGIQVSDLLEAGKRMNLSVNKCQKIIDSVTKAVKDWPKFAEEAGVSEKSMEEIRDNIRIDP